MQQRLIHAATQFASCTHPPGSVGKLFLNTSGDTLEQPTLEPTGSAWCQRCGALRTGADTWRATLYRFEITVAAANALTSHDALTAKLEEARVCSRELADALRETASAPVTSASLAKLEQLARSAEEMAEGLGGLARELAEPPPPLETIAMADRADAAGTSP